METHVPRLHHSSLGKCSPDILKATGAWIKAAPTPCKQQNRDIYKSVWISQAHRRGANLSKYAHTAEIAGEMGRAPGIISSARGLPSTDRRMSRMSQSRRSAMHLAIRGSRPTQILAQIERHGFHRAFIEAASMPPVHAPCGRRQGPEDSRNCQMPVRNPAVGRIKSCQCHGYILCDLFGGRIVVMRAAISSIKRMFFILVITVRDG